MLQQLKVEMNQQKTLAAAATCFNYFQIDTYFVGLSLRLWGQRKKVN